MKAFIAGMALALLSTVASAAGYSGIPDRLFEQIKAKEFEKAMDTGGVRQNLDPEVRAQMIQYMDKAFGGEYKFHELVEQRFVGTRYVTLTYLVGMKDGPAGLRIQLYKAEDTWKPITFWINSDYEALIRGE